MRRIKIGDIVEITTPSGLAYAQYTHKHHQYGALLRVYNQIYASRPQDIKGTINDSPTFSCFFPLGAAVNRNIVVIAGNSEVPMALQAFPVFRDGTADPQTNKVAVWWLWDGVKEWRIGDISQEQRKLSILGVWNDTYLIDRIVSGWTPENDPT